MLISERGSTGHGTYFVTSSCWGKRALFQTDRMSSMVINVLLHYRSERKYALHGFVIMPDHLHLLITPALTLEKCMQLIKGGFSFRAKKELGFIGEVWQTSFHDRRVRDAMEYRRFQQYIWENPVRRGLCEAPAAFPYSSASEKFVLDEVPQRLKPQAFGAVLPQA
jgi:putative transposase